MGRITLLRDMIRSVSCDYTIFFYVCIRLLYVKDARPPLHYGRPFIKVSRQLQMAMAILDLLGDDLICCPQGVNPARSAPLCGCGVDILWAADTLTIKQIKDFLCVYAFYSRAGALAPGFLFRLLYGSISFL